MSTEKRELNPQEINQAFETLKDNGKTGKTKNISKVLPGRTDLLTKLFTDPCLAALQKEPSRIDFETLIKIDPAKLDHILSPESIALLDSGIVTLNDLDKLPLEKLALILTKESIAALYTSTTEQIEGVAFEAPQFARAGFGEHRNEVRGGKIVTKYSKGILDFKELAKIDTDKLKLLLQPSVIELLKDGTKGITLDELKSIQTNRLEQILKPNCIPLLKTGQLDLAILKEIKTSRLEHILAEKGLTFIEKDIFNLEELSQMETDRLAQVSGENCMSALIEYKGKSGQEFFGFKTKIKALPFDSKTTEKLEKILAPENRALVEKISLSSLVKASRSKLDQVLTADSVYVLLKRPVRPGVEDISSQELFDQICKLGMDQETTAKLNILFQHKDLDIFKSIDLNKVIKMDASLLTKLLDSPIFTQTQITINELVTIQPSRLEQIITPAGVELLRSHYILAKLKDMKTSKLEQISQPACVDALNKHYIKPSDLIGLKTDEETNRRLKIIFETDGFRRCLPGVDVANKSITLERYLNLEKSQFDLIHKNIGVFEIEETYKSIMMRWLLPDMLDIKTSRLEQLFTPNGISLIVDVEIALQDLKEMPTDKLKQILQPNCLNALQLDEHKVAKDRLKDKIYKLGFDAKTSEKLENILSPNHISILEAIDLDDLIKLGRKKLNQILQLNCIAALKNREGEARTKLFKSIVKLDTEDDTNKRLAVILQPAHVELLDFISLDKLITVDYRCLKILMFKKYIEALKQGAITASIADVPFDKMTLILHPDFLGELSKKVNVKQDDLTRLDTPMLELLLDPNCIQSWRGNKLDQLSLLTKVGYDKLYSVVKDPRCVSAVVGEKAHQTQFSFYTLATDDASLKEVRKPRTTTVNVINEDGRMGQGKSGDVPPPKQVDHTLSKQSLFAGKKREEVPTPQPTKNPFENDEAGNNDDFGM